MSTELQESILQAISKIADDSVNKAKSDLTIECEIVKVQNSAKGIYTVQYTENKFTAHSSNGATYSVGNSVYVLVPEGDFSKNKVIVGLTKAALPEVNTKKEEKFYNEISPNFLDDIGEIQLCTYHTETKEYTPAKQLISALIEPYNNFVFQVDVRTDIKDMTQRNTGRYGIKIRIPVLNTDLNEVGDMVSSEDYIEKILDIEHMIGDVYGFNIYTKQQEYFDFEGRRYDNSRPLQVVAFVEGFIQNEDVTTPDIFFKNIELKAVEKLTEEDLAGYYLSIKCSEGFEFLSGAYTADKILQPELVINGASVSVKDYECYWFRENVNINDSSDYYVSLGGAGWQVLNDRKRVDIDNEGNPIYKYDTLKNYSLRVKQENIFYKARYKCVLVDSNGSYEKVVTITNLNNDIDVSLETTTGLRTYIKDVGQVTLDASLRFPGAPTDALFQYRFSRTDKEGVTIQDEQPFYTVKKQDVVEGSIRTTEIAFPVAQIDELTTITCEFVYQRVVKDPNTLEDKLEEETIGTASITLTTGETLSDYIVNIENDDVVYKYDANGVAPNQGTFDGPIESRIPKLQPLVFRLIKTENNLELSTSEYSQLKITWQVPKESLYVIGEDQETEMSKKATFKKTEDDDYVYYTGKGLQELHYDIEPSFDNTKKDAVIFVSYTFDGKEPSPTNIYIPFLKDGESGTNGRQYSTYITYEGYGYGELDRRGLPHKFRGISANGVWKKYDSNAKRIRDFLEGGAPVFDVKVYQGSKLLTSGYSISWSMVDPTTDNSTTFSIATLADGKGRLSTIKNWTERNARPVNVIQVDVTVTAPENKKNTKESEVVTAFYPLDVAFFSSENPFVPSIEDGYSVVTYENDLTEPKCNTNKPFKVKTIDDSIEFIVNGWEHSNSFEEDEENNYTKERNILPESRYDIDNISYQNNYVAVQITPNSTLTTTKQREIKTEIDTLEFNKEELAIKENFYADLHSLYDYSNYINKLNECEQVLNYKAKYTLYLKDLYDLAKDISDIDNAYSAYEAMVSEVIYNVLDASSVDDIDKYEGGEIPVPSENSSVILEDLINQFNDKINECNVMYNMTLRYDHAPSELSNLSSIVNALKSLSEDVNNINIDDKYTELVKVKTQVSNAVKALANDISITTSKNSLVKTFDQIQEIFNSYQMTDYDAQLKSQWEEDLVTAYQSMGMETQIDNSVVVIVRPIVFTVNRRGLAAINGWDGNKLYTGNNDEYLFAPQLGAGTVNSAGDFTGMVMGKKRTGTGTNDSTQIGLFGYKDSLETISLDAETGVLTLGSYKKPNGQGNGQIILDPTGTSYIAGWTFTEDTLEKHNNARNHHFIISSDDADAAINVYGSQGSTTISYDGVLRARGAELDYAEVSGTITASDGQIGGWYINGNYLSSEDNINNASIVLDPINDKIYVGNIFLDGGNNVITVGSGAEAINIDSYGSEVGDYQPTIYSGTGLTGSYADGFILSKDKFFVGQKGYSNYGYIEFDGTTLTVQGTINSIAGDIGGWKISSDGLFGNYDYYEGYKTQLKPNFFKLGSIEIDMDNNGRFRSIYNGHSIACIKTVRQTYRGEYIGAIGVSTGETTSSGGTDFIWMAGAGQTNYLTISTGTGTTFPDVNGNGNLMCNTVNCNSIYLRGKQENITSYIDSRIKALVKSGSLK